MDDSCLGHYLPLKKPRLGKLSRDSEGTLGDFIVTSQEEGSRLLSRVLMSSPSR